MPSSTTKLFIQSDKSPKHMQNRSVDSSRMLVRPKRSTLTVPYHADTGNCGRYAHKSGRRGTESFYLYYPYYCHFRFQKIPFLPLLLFLPLLVFLPFFLFLPFLLIFRFLLLLPLLFLFRSHFLFLLLLLFLLLFLSLHFLLSFSLHFLYL